MFWKRAGEAGMGGRSSDPGGGVPGFEPFTKERIRRKMPDEATVEQMWAEFIADIGLIAETRAEYDRRPLAGKWEMMVQQNEVDRKIIAPEALLKDLREKTTAEGLASLALHLSRDRLSWVRRFIDADGHLFLLDIAGRSARSSKKMTEEQSSILAGSLACLREVCNVGSCVEKVASASNALRLIINSIVPSNPATVIHVLEISLCFLFMDTLSLERKKENIQNLLECFRTVKRQQNGWRILADLVKKRPSPEVLKAVACFFEGVLYSMSQFHSLRADFLLEIDKAGVIEDFSRVSDVRPETEQVIAHLLDEWKSLREIFPTRPLNPFKLSTVIGAVYDSSEFPYMISNIALSLLDLSGKKTPAFGGVTQLFFNIINLLRIHIATKSSKSLSDVCDIANSLKTPVQLVFQKTENYVRAELAESSKFPIGDDLLGQPLDAIVSEAGLGRGKDGKKGDTAKTPEVAAKPPPDAVSKQQFDEVSRELTTVRDTLAITIKERLEADENVKLLTTKVNELTAQLTTARKEADTRKAQIEQRDSQIAELKQLLAESTRQVDALKQAAPSSAPPNGGSGLPPPPLPPPPPPGGMDAPPPPPPPPPGMGGPQPPPPPPGLGGPPPPPPGMGGPPPPGMGPPPPGGPPGGLPQKPNPKPARSVRAWYWNKVPDMQISRTLWKDIDDSTVAIEEGELLDLFGQAAPIQRTVSAPTAEPAAAKPKAVELLDGERTKALQIRVFSRLRRPNEQIVEAVRGLDEKLSEDDLRALKDNAPTAEEITTVLGYDGDSSAMGRAEQFVLAVAGVKLFSSHLAFLLLQQTFEAQMADIERPLGIFTTGLQALKGSKKLKEFLALVLRLGNFLNGGTARGGAYGFKFDFIDKLREVRTQKPGYLLFHFIGEKFPVPELVAELLPIKKMVTVDLETTRKSYAAIESSFKEIQAAMPEAEKLVGNNTFSYRLFPQFTAFKAKTKDRLQAPLKSFETISDDYGVLVRAWGEDPDQTPMPEFIGVYVRLIDELQKCHDQNEKRRADEKKAAERAERLAAGGAGPAGGGHGRPPGGRQAMPGMNIRAGDGQRGCLDELMSKLGGGITLRKVPPRGG